VGIVFTIGILFSALGYAGTEDEEVAFEEITKRKKRKWFSRALARVGLTLKAIPKTALKDQSTWEAFLVSQGLHLKHFEEACALERERFVRQLRKGRIFTRENLMKSKPIGIFWTYAYTPHLDAYSIDLAESDPTEYRDVHFFGRDDEQELAALVLERSTQANALFIAEPGIGKRTLIHSLARHIRENRAGSSLFGCRILLLDLGRVLSDTVARGEDGEAAVRALCFEATLAGNIILAIENFDQYFEKQNDRSSLGAVFSDMLQYPSFQVIGTMHQSAYQHFVSDHAELLKYFEPIIIHEPTEEETYLALIAKFEAIESRRVLFTFAAYRKVVELSKRYEWQKAFPERAIDLAEEVILHWKEHSSNQYIFAEDVEKFVSMKTGMPVGEIGAEERGKLLELETILSRRVLGQEEAVKQVAEAFRRHRSGLGEEGKPMGSFLFLGPTGVGKTETAKALAEVVFDDEERMIRLDMSEYQGADAVTRLIGSRETGETGRLADLAREYPYSILLLDEIEKAYPRALDLFLQVLDEGFLTDGFGQKVNLRNMVIIATSNAGANLIRDAIIADTSMTDLRKRVLDAVITAGIFRPEFLNRFGSIVFFKPLADEHLKGVIEKRLQKFVDRLKTEKDVALTFDPGVTEKIIEVGYEPEFGARSLNRFMEDSIEDVVIKKLLEGEVTAGGQIVIHPEDIEGNR
ncbi:MAG: AAA family ATPase, partial [Candidatus Moraniibacteriota bacterium]